MRIRPATRRDLPDIATIVANAMMDDDFSLWLSPDQVKYPETHRQRVLRSTFRRWNAGQTMLVTETEEGDDGWTGSPQVVAYAAYEKSVGAPDDTSKVGATMSKAIERFLASIHDNYIYYFCNSYNTIRSRVKIIDEVMGADPISSGCDRYWELDFLAVEPKFYRRGLGTQLVNWGKARAAEDGVPLLLLASVMGEPLYLRQGFKEVRKMKIHDELISPVMRWDPPAQTSTEP